MCVCYAGQQAFMCKSFNQFFSHMDYYHLDHSQWPWAKSVYSSSHIFGFWSGWNLTWCWCSFSSNALILLLIEIHWNKANNCCVADCIKNWHWHLFRCIWSSLLQTWYHDKYYHTLHFDFRVIDLDLCSRSQGCKKLSLKVFNTFGWNLACCWNLLVWWF